MNKLFIDTTDRRITKVSLVTESGKKDLGSSNNYKSQETLKLIQKLLKLSKLNPEDIEEIEVKEGPGSFTGIKVGLSVANALGYSLGLKVNGKKAGQVEAIYS